MGGIFISVFFVIMNMICMGFTNHMLKADGKPNKNLRYNVTFASAYIEAPEVEEVCQQGVKQIKTGSIIFVVLNIAAIFIPGFSISLTVFLVLAFAYLSWTFYLYAKLHGELMRVKTEKNYGIVPVADVVADIGTIALVRKEFHLLPHIPVLIFSFVPVVLLFVHRPESSLFGWELVTYLCMIFVVVLMIFCPWYYCSRIKNESITECSSLNQALSRVRKNQICRMSLYVNYWTVPMIIAIWMLLQNQPGYIGWAMALIGISSAGMIWTVMAAELKVRREQSGLMKKYGTDVVVDDDKYWIGGQLYDNPNDNHLIVSTRTGINTTVNLARTSGKIIMFLAGAITIVLVSLLCIWCILEEYQPIHIQVVNEAIQVRHVFTTYEISKEDMESVTLKTELPDLRRRVGSAIDNFCSGSFTARNVGNFEVCLYTDIGEFIYIEAKDGTNYIFTGNSAEETKEIYGEIIKK